MLAAAPAIELKLGLVAEVGEGRGAILRTRVSGDVSPSASSVVISAAARCST